MGELRQSADMFPVADWGEAIDRGVGAFCFEHVEDGVERYEALIVIIPTNRAPLGESVMLSLRPAKPSHNPATWEFDGNRERPTLSPSVHLPGQWHGFVRAGRLESC